MDNRITEWKKLSKGDKERAEWNFMKQDEWQYNGTSDKYESSKDRERQQR